MNKISGTTKLIGLLANPAEHSRSPEIHNEAFRWLGLDFVYLAFDVKPHQLKEAIWGMKALGARGWNLSMPHKQEMMNYLDEIEEHAKLIGSVNTVVHRDGKLFGYNTDGAGFIRSMEQQGLSIRDKKITLSGSGGAGLAVTVACLRAGAEVSIFNRAGKSAERVRILKEKLKESGFKNEACRLNLYDNVDEEAFRKEMKSSHLYINGTPLGMVGQEQQSPVEDADLFSPEMTVCDLIYQPSKTKMLTLAQESGCRIINGEGMLFYQAAESFRLWTGRQMPEDIREHLFDK